MKFLALLFILVSSSGLAQNGSISGNVVDATDGAGIEFATITLFSANDSSLVNGVVSDVEGRFKLEKLGFGNYYLRVRFIGYREQTIGEIALSPESSPLNLDQIQLKVSTQLDAVDVTANKSVFETKIDKKVFNADQSLVSKGGTGLDLLRQVPSITIDQNDNILLRGDGNVTILIDGRPSAMPVNELMKQLPASAIEKVEIITNPSAKYDPEGMSGIINIVLKKNKLEGFNGTLNASVGYGVFPKYRGSLALNYRKDKVNITGNYNYNYSKVWFGGDMRRDVLIDSVWDILTTDDYGERISQSHYGSLGIDYFINDFNTFYASASYNESLTLGTRSVNYRNLDESLTIVDFSNRSGNISAPNTNMVLNTGWQKTFSKPDHTLDLDINYANSTLSTDERLRHSYFNLPDTVDLASSYLNLYQNTAENNDNSNLLSKLDYVLPISDSLTLEAGFHYTRRGADNSFYSESAVEDEGFLADVQLNNSFEYLQNVFATYATLGRQFKKIGIKVGVRAESTETGSALVNTGENFSNDYFKLFPSAHFSYKTNKNSEFQLSYSKRINRPEMFQLNPFTNYSDPFTLQTGNPFLKPEIIHVNEFSYLKFWKKFNLNAAVYYRLITDLIRRTLVYDGPYSAVTYTNLGQSSLSGGDLNLTFTPNRELRIMSSTSFWNTRTDDVDITGGTPQNFFGMNTVLQAFYQMKGGWSTQLWASYSPDMEVLQGIIAPNYGGGFAVQKSILKQRGTINLSVVDILKSRRFSFDSYDLENYSFGNTRRWESRSVYLTFTYGFGKMTQGKTKRQSRSTGISDDNDVPELQ